MIVRTYPGAADFLARTQTALEADEAANSLMLGVCLGLKRFPEKTHTAPYLVTVEDEKGLSAAAVMTPPHNLVVYGARADLGAAPATIMRDLALHQWRVPGVFGPTAAAEAFADAWSRVSGAAYDKGARQRVYRLTKVVHPKAIRGSLRVATENDVKLITRWISGFEKEIFSVSDLDEARQKALARIGARDIFVWEDRKPVSMAARSRPTPHGISVDLVFTPPAYRRRGYATACVAGMSQVLLDLGWEFCALFADLSNRTSNRIYQKIGYESVCDFDEYVFKQPSKA